MAEMEGGKRVTSDQKLWLEGQAGQEGQDVRDSGFYSGGFYRRA